MLFPASCTLYVHPNVRLDIHGRVSKNKKKSVCERQGKRMLATARDSEEAFDMQRKKEKKCQDVEMCEKKNGVATPR